MCQGLHIILVLGRERQESNRWKQTGLHNNAQSAEKEAKEDTFSLGTRSPSTLSRSFSFPNHQAGGWVLQIPTEPGPVPGQEDTTNTLCDRDHHRLLLQFLWKHSQPASPLSPPSWCLLPWVHLPLVLPETIPSFPSFPITKAEAFRVSQFRESTMNAGLDGVVYIVPGQPWIV